MTATYAQAIDDIFTVVKTAWDTTGHLMAWPDAPNAGVPPTTQVPWARTTLRHVPAGPPTLTGADGTARYPRAGIVTVQIFTPRGNGLSSAYALAKIISDGFEGKHTPRQVWFRNVRAVEAGPDGNYNQVNVLADFTYDEVK